MLSVAVLALALLPLGMILGNWRLYSPPPSLPPREEAGRGVGEGAISVLIPARNEEANIAAACAAVLTSTHPAFELVVMDDHSTDRTRAILDAIVDPRLRVADAPPLPPGWSGKQHACASLAAVARHDLMLFVDADVRLAPDALSRIAGFMEANPASGLASGFPHQVTKTWSEILLLPLIHFLLLGFLPIWQMRRSTAPALGAACGQLIVVRGEAYARAGGHAAIRASLHDGVTLPRAFRRAGSLTLLFDADRLASCRMYASAAQVWEGLTKNATEGMAKPLALPVWTAILGLGQVAPWLWLVAAPNRIVAVACAATLLARLLLAARFRQPLVSAFLHPIGIAALLLVQWASLLRAARGGRATWRGRAYPAQ